MLQKGYPNKYFESQWLVHSAINIKRGDFFPRRSGASGSHTAAFDGISTEYGISECDSNIPLILYVSKTRVDKGEVNLDDFTFTLGTLDNVLVFRNTSSLFLQELIVGVHIIGCD